MCVPLLMNEVWIKHEDQLPDHDAPNESYGVIKQTMLYHYVWQPCDFMLLAWTAHPFRTPILSLKQRGEFKTVVSITYILSLIGLPLLPGLSSLWLNFQNGTNVTYPSQKILLLEMPFRKWLQIAFGIYQHLCHYYENTDTGEVASAYMSDVARNYFKHRQRHLCKNHIRQRWWHAQLCQIRSGLDTQRSRFSGF